LGYYSFFIIYFLAAALSTFVFRDKPLWRAFPVHVVWMFAGVLAALLQLLYSTISLHGSSVQDDFEFLREIPHPWTLTLAALVSPIVVIGANEAVKYQEIE